ncbi:protein-disulfide reductase DsbD domain-containing protein [Phenylobacterium sp.]|uniref:protein-disulfide reductase DsbD domain-containing protein n=1 Tax=Phenylobacterium sp. TaxID=1871053 RepID=UPI0025EE0399|nr:protein-disulfide reductase DsbD domain-containing protein [Phenylobacterium sp.]
MRSSVHILALSGLILASVAGAAVAQPGAGPGAGGDTVTWTAAPAGGEGVKPGALTAVTLQAVVRPGWHVYGLDQTPTGPTPLRVNIEASAVAKADAAPRGSPPIKEHSRAFDTDTEFYASAFTVTAPVRIAPHAAAGRQQIPVSVQFQTCNGDICQPPKTVRLSVPVTIRAQG